jgi:renalase
MTTLPPALTPSNSVVVIGAGLAGLTAAHHLQAAGRSVVVLEKSRGLGGRLNTRRHLDSRADRGVPYLEPQGPLTAAWIQELQSTCDLQPWPQPLHHLTAEGLQTIPGDQRWAMPTGLSSAAKQLATGLTIARGHRAIALTAPANPGQPWTIQCDFPAAIEPEQQQEFWTAGAIVLAIPAPQAADLLESVAPDWAKRARQVTFDPCFSVTAAYPPDRELQLPGGKAWQGIRAQIPTDWRWLAREDSKADGIWAMGQPVLLLQSSAAVAERLWDVPTLEAVGQALLDRAGADLGLDLQQPEWIQVHRWRYAIARNPLAEGCWIDPDRALAVAGDWCVAHPPGQSLEATLRSGLSAAQDLLAHCF